MFRFFATCPRYDGFILSAPPRRTAAAAQMELVKAEYLREGFLADSRAGTLNDCARLSAICQAEYTRAHLRQSAHRRDASEYLSLSMTVSEIAYSAQSCAVI